jgi:prolyl-tRNA synthetase
VQKGTVALARRDRPGREGKSFVPQEGLTERIEALLDDIQQALYDRALRFRDDHLFDVSTYDEFKERVESGFVRCYWDGDDEDEARVKEETRATVRVIPFDQPEVEGHCMLTGRPTLQQVIFAKSY